MRLPSSSGHSAPIVPRSVAVRTAFFVAVLLGVSACAGGVSGTPRPAPAS